MENRSHALELRARPEHDEGGSTGDTKGLPCAELGEARRELRAQIILLALVAFTATLTTHLAVNAYERTATWCCDTGFTTAWDLVCFTVATPLLFLLARRAPIDETPRALRVGSHITAWCLGAATRALIQLSRSHSDLSASIIWRDAGATVVTGVVAFAGLDLLAHAVLIIQRHHEREMQRLQLTTTITTLRQRALREQLDQHFLLNTLNAAVALAHRNPELAAQVLTSLGSLVSATCEDDMEQVPLGEALELVQQYLTIMQVRFPRRLTLSVHADEGSTAALIPKLLLLPIVENALGHGLGRLSHRGTVSLRITTGAGSLKIVVETDGEGLVLSAKNDGVGLRLTEYRLRALYGTAATFELKKAEAGGARAILSIPQRRSHRPP